MNKKTNREISKILANFAIVMIIVATLFSFESEHRILYAINIVLYVTSIFLGLKGITINTEGKNKLFDWQAKTGLIGIIIFIISLFVNY
jgi:uncharacterized membrane protein HdeD (DUF308 family)